jgi:hypothetical protein
MQIHTGLFDQCVIQRDLKTNASNAVITGTSSVPGVIEARITNTPTNKAAKPSVVRGFNWVAVGKSTPKGFSAVIKGLPVGGPYDVAVRIKGKDGKPHGEATIKNILVGDVWIAAGQSNMQGCGRFVDRDTPHPLVRAFYMDDHWDVAEDPIHQLEIAVDSVHNGGDRKTKPVPTLGGVGPAVSFAKCMHQYTGVPQGILACAHGGTSMAQWCPTLKNKPGAKPGESLYGASVRRLQKNGGKIAGVIWYQGESDASEPASNIYTDKMRELIASYRKDSSTPTLPFVLVQLSRFVVDNTSNIYWNSVQEQQRRLPELIKHVSTVPAIDLSLDDGIHISGVSNLTLGRRLAEAMHTLRAGKRAIKPPITLQSIKAAPAVDAPHLADITVEFDNVEGELTSGISRPVGFSVLDTQPTAAAYDIRISGKTATVRTALNMSNTDSRSLSYGVGTNPFCNIVDSAGRSLPVFGPVALHKPRAMTHFVQKWRVSLPQPSAGRLQGLAHPDVNAMTWRVIDFPNRHADLHLEVEKLPDADPLFYYACVIHSAEPMKLAANLGYDGPVKLWIDGKELFHDPNGTNPAVEDAKKIRFDTSIGKHEIVIAFGSNQRKAWGVFLRFDRVDVSPAQIKQGQGAYKLPDIAP